MLANCLGISKIKYLCYEDMSSLCPVDGDHLSEKSLRCSPYCTYGHRFQRLLWESMLDSHAKSSA